MTFRTECAFDADLVPSLMDELSFAIVDRKMIQDAVCPSFEMGMFTIEVPEHYTVEDVRSIMCSKIDCDDQYIDMHRCYQTLNEGLTPNEKWYLG